MAKVPCIGVMDLTLKVSGAKMREEKVPRSCQMVQFIKEIS